MNKQKMQDHRMSDDEYEADQKAADEWAVEHASRVEDVKALLYDGEPTNVKGVDFIQVFSAALEELSYTKAGSMGTTCINEHLHRLLLTIAWYYPIIYQHIQSHVDVICGDAVTTEMEADKERGHE